MAKAAPASIKKEIEGFARSFGTTSIVITSSMTRKFPTPLTTS